MSHRSRDLEIEKYPMVMKDICGHRIVCFIDELSNRGIGISNDNEWGHVTTTQILQEGDLLERERWIPIMVGEC
jgi:hypothetical protein